MQRGWKIFARRACKLISHESMGRDCKELGKCLLEFDEEVIGLSGSSM